MHLHYGKRTYWIAFATLTGAIGLACTLGGNTESQGQTALGVKVGGDDDGGGGGGGHDPAGNNGTVKIQEAGAADEIPDNDPHVGCIFNIEFRGFDKGAYDATWTLAAHPPSGQGQTVASGTVFIGEDPAGGAPDLDAVVRLHVLDSDLAGLARHPEQGYHLKLEVHAEGAKGADIKHKVFWVEGCPSDAGTTSSSSGGSSSGGSSSGGSSSSSSSGGSSGKTF
jgi:hypothetical protein